MNIKQLGSNQTLLVFHQKEILFSYETPVAGYIKGRGYFRTDKRYSATTSKHINKYVEGWDDVLTLPQEEIDNLVLDKQ